MLNWLPLDRMAEYLALSFAVWLGRLTFGVRGTLFGALSTGNHGNGDGLFDDMRSLETNLRVYTDGSKGSVGS